MSGVPLSPRDLTRKHQSRMQRTNATNSQIMLRTPLPLLGRNVEFLIRVVQCQTVQIVIRSAC